MPIEERDRGGEIHVGRPAASSSSARTDGSSVRGPVASHPRREPISPPSGPGGSASPTTVPPADAPTLATQEGDATWYSDSLAGGPTASGERYSPRALTAAHRRLPLGTWVRVTRRDTGATVVVRVNDRGPFGSARRIIDLSRRAAEELRMIRRGVAPVRLEVLRYGEGRPSRGRRRRSR
ncbi:MAG: septal ring lytic transglycosylase RlpA family protein [Deltaproteobacteria bacterium]|nr:septal ring lytic transglycosylase RlpA family protein [Deltaproteobacteria bacterium]